MKLNKGKKCLYWNGVNILGIASEGVVNFKRSAQWRNRKNTLKLFELCSCHNLALLLKKYMKNWTRFLERYSSFT
jgi:hypothetical protein